MAFFGNEQMPQQEVWKPSLGDVALGFGLSMLANNNGRQSFGELVGNSGLNTLQSIQMRKKLEAEQARKAEQDAMARQAHEMAMQKQEGELADAQRMRKLLSDYQQSGDTNLLRSIDPIGFAKLQEQIRANKAKEKNDLDIAALRASMVSGNGGDYMKIDANARKELHSLAELDEFTNYFEDAYKKAFTEDENGFKQGGTGFFVGSLPNWAKTRFDPHGNEFRSALANFSSQIMNWLSGAAVSDQERVRLEGFLPTPTDDEAALEAKIKGYRDFVRSKGKAWKNVYGDNEVFRRMRTFTPKKDEKKKESSFPELPEGFEMVQ